MCVLLDTHKRPADVKIQLNYHLRSRLIEFSIFPLKILILELWHFHLAVQF